MFQHQSTFIPHVVGRQTSGFYLNDSEAPLPMMAQKPQISNNGGQSIPVNKAPAAVKQSPVSYTRRKYFCEYCSKSFTRSGHLEMHRRTHTGERPYVCQYCNRAFTQSSALYRHHKTCANSPHKGNDELLSKTGTMLDVSSAGAKQQKTAFSTSSDSVSAPHDNSTSQDNKDESSDDDDIMFVCCDCTFNCPADYDKHVETHHPKSHSSDSLSPIDKPGGGGNMPSVATVQLSSNSYGHNVTSRNNAGLDLSPMFVPVLGQGTNACEPNTRVIDNESGIVYLFNDTTKQDMVTINLSEHSVNLGGGSGGNIPKNLSLMDECSNPGMKQVMPKLTGSSNDSVNDDDDDDAVIVEDDDDDDVCIETVSMTTKQNTDRLNLHDEIFITENNSSKKRQINQLASRKKQKEKYSRFLEPLFDVAHRSSYYDADPHQKSMSGSVYIRNLPDSLSFERSAPDNINKKVKDANNQQKSVETTENNTGFEKPCGQTVSGYNRLKTSRLQSCQFCSRQFIRNSHLTQHLRTHTGERPFRCEYCGNAFTQSSALNRHFKTCNIAQSVNSSVAGNTTSSHQSSALSLDFNAGNDVFIPYPRDVFQQSASLDSHLITHEDSPHPKVDMRISLSKCNSMLLQDGNSTAGNHYSAVSPTSIPKSKSCITKTMSRSIEGQATQPKKKFLLQKSVKGEKMLRCDICCLEFVSRQHLAAHVRKHQRSNPASVRTVQSLSRNLPTSNLAWALYMKNKHLFRNKVYNTLKYKRNFEKQKSSILATNSQFGRTVARPKTYSFVEKIVKKSKNPSGGSKAENCRTSDQPHHSKVSQVRNISSENKKILVSHQSLEKSTQNSVDTGTNRNPRNSLYISGSANETDPHRPNRISTQLYSCDICAKSFYSDLLFRIHRATHSLGKKKKKPTPQSTSDIFQDKQLKTYPCIYCHKRFLRHSHLETHVRTHTGEKPFQCESCGRAFSQSSARNRHRNKTCFVARQIMNSVLVSPSSNHPDAAASVWNIPGTQDEDTTSSVLFTCCDQSFHSSIDLNTHILSHKSGKHPRSEETGLDSTPLSSQSEAELQNRKTSEDNGRETTNYISGSPIKSEESTDNDLNIDKYEQRLVDGRADDSVLKTGKSQKPLFESDAKESVPECNYESKDGSNPAVKNEFDVFESKIFDSALQVVHDSLQIKSGVNLQQSTSNQTKDVLPSEPDPGSLEPVSSQNCPDLPDLCPSPSDIPQPNVSLSLGSEFVDIMDTDLPSISNTIPCSQEEDSSAQQKDIFLEYSPETPPFVGECLLTQSAGADDLMGREEKSKDCKSLSGGVSEMTPDLDGPGKNYSCDYCDKIFSRLDHLNDHVRMHTGERFFCPSCSTAFTQTGALGRHLKICASAADYLKKESISKNHPNTPSTVAMGQDALTNKRDTDESINGYKLPSLDSLEATMNNRDDVNTNDNLQEPFENWALTSFSNSDVVKSEDMNGSISSENKKEENAENTDNSLFEKVIRPNQLKHLTGSTLNVCEGETPIETDSQTPTRKFTCPHCDRHFASSSQRDEHVSCHAVKKPYICWFCKETYVSSLDFEQHLKICGAPTTFPNLSSSPNTSKEEVTDDEDSKFDDIVLFTPLTASGNLSDCEEGVGEADVTCTGDQTKDTGVSQHLQQGADNEFDKPEGGQEEKEEKNQEVVKTFESVEFISGQSQENSPGDSGSNPDACSKYAPDFVLLEDNLIDREKNDNTNDCLQMVQDNYSTVQNVTHDRSTSNQSKTNVNLEDTFRKERINVRDKTLQKDFNIESLSRRSLIQPSEYITNMESECLKTQSSSEASNDSIVFLCCQQTYTEVQDYNRHLFNCHPTQEQTDKLKDLEQQQVQPSRIPKDGSTPNEDSSLVSKQSDVGDCSLPQSNLADQQRYVCSYCTRGFSRSSHLIQHMRTHTGERPFPCKFCSKAFTQSSAVNRHLKTCIKAKLFHDKSVKIVSTNYKAVMPEFQQTLPGESSSVSPSPVQSLNDMKCNNISEETDLFQQPSNVTFKSIDHIPHDESNEGIKCEHCGLKCLKLDDFTQHCKTCPSTDGTPYLSRAYHQEDCNPDEVVDNDEIYSRRPQHGCHLELVEIKKEVVDVYKCEICHQSFTDESELVRHQESHSAPSEQQRWNMTLNFGNGENRKTIKDEERSIFNCCGQMFFDSESYNFHMEVHHSFKVEDDYSEINEPDVRLEERQNSSKNIAVKNEAVGLDQISCNTLADDSFFNSSLQGRQLLSIPENKVDDVIGKKMSDEVSGLSSVDRSTVLDNITRFQVFESVKEISQPETSILPQRIDVSDIDNRMSDSDNPITSKGPHGMSLSVSPASERTLTSDMNMDWLQWKNYITGHFVSSSLSTAGVMPREKKYACDYCDKRFTRSGHLVMHRRTHTGERPFRCLHCQKAFTQSSALNRHLKTCNLARLAVIGNVETQVPFPATEEDEEEDEIQLICCGKNFYRTGAINVHLVTHNIYKCHCCSLDFENFNLLLIHMKSRDPHEQLPVSNSRGPSIDNHCDLCPASFQSVIDQLIHMKTEHQANVSKTVSTNNHISPNKVNFQKQLFPSSKTTYLDNANFSKDSDVLCSKKYTNPSLDSISSQQKQPCSSRPNMGKMSRFRQLLSSTFRMPSKLNAFSKHRQNKLEMYPTSTLHKRRYSILFPEHKLAGSPEFTQCGSSVRNLFNHSVRRVFKRGVNNISKHGTFSERFTPSSNVQALTQTNHRQTSTSVVDKRFLDQRDQTDIVQTLLNKKDRQGKNSKHMSKKNLIENNSFVQIRKNLPNKPTLNDRDVDYYPEGEFDNDLKPEGSSHQAASSMAMSLEQEKRNRTQSGKHLPKSGMRKHPSLKSRPSNSLLLKRSLLTSGLGRSGTEKSSLLTKAIPIPLKFNFKYSKYKRTSGLPVTISSKSSDIVCIVCQKCFTCSSHLKLHLRTHAEVWPYVCRSCNRYFIQASALNRHRKNCPYRNRNSTNSNSQPNRNSILQNPGTSKLSNALLDDERDTPASALDKGEISLSMSQNEADTIKNSKEVLSDEHDGLLASFYPAVDPSDDTFDPAVEPSPKKQRDYLNADNLTCPKDPLDRTGFTSHQSAHSQKDKPKSEKISGQLVTGLSRQLTSGLEDSTLATPPPPPCDRREAISHTCKKCGDMFPQLTDLNQHKCYRRADRHPFFCEYCDKSFPRHSRLVTHRRTHTGERPYQCLYCQRSFTQSGALNRHKKICSFIPTHLKTTPPVIGSSE